MINGPRITNPIARFIGYAFLSTVAILMSKDGHSVFAFGIIMMAVGGFLNTLVMMKNKGRMPVYVPGNQGDVFDVFLTTRKYYQYIRFQDKDDPEIRLKILADRFYPPFGMFSLGDFVADFSILFLMAPIFLG